MSEKCDVELNLLEICRLCLTEEGNKTSIFQKMGCDIPLTVQISFCVSLEVRAGDGLPELICQNCTSHVNSWYIFKKQCQKSEAHLRDYLSKRVSIAPSKNNETEIGDTESAVEDKVSTRRNGYRNVPKYFKSVYKRRVTSTSKQKHSSRGKDKTGAQDEKGLIRSTCDVILEGSLKEEDLRREGCDVVTQFETALQTKEEDTKNELELGAAVPSRIYTCNVCQRTFSSKSYLQDHEATHSGDKQFTCKVREKPLEDCIYRSVTKLSSVQGNLNCT